MLVVVLNMPEHSSFQDMLFPMLFISKYAKSYASIMDISLVHILGGKIVCEDKRFPWDLIGFPNGISGRNLSFYSTHS